MAAAATETTPAKTRAKDGQKAEGGRASREPAATPPRQSPLAFALGIMRDDSKPDALRVTMAKAAMPYLHKRGEEQEHDEDDTPEEEPISDFELARRIAHIIGLGEAEGFRQLEAAKESCTRGGRKSARGRGACTGDGREGPCRRSDDRGPTAQSGAIMTAARAGRRISAARPAACPKTGLATALPVGRRTGAGVTFTNVHGAARGFIKKSHCGPPARNSYISSSRKYLLISRREKVRPKRSA